MPLVLVHNPSALVSLTLHWKSRITLNRNHLRSLMSQESLPDMIAVVIKANGAYCRINNEM